MTDIDWEIKGSATLNNGRFLLTPEKSGRYEGSLWNKNFKLSKKSWTIDFVFRALGEIGKTGNGLVFWLLNDSRGNVERLVQADTGLYGGPTRFDGFAIAVDSNGPLGSTLSGYANDGTGTLTTDSPNFHKLAFGKCIIGYQNSQVPATIRISYDEFKHQFKVSIDNKICFETNQFKIPENENNFIVGVSAESGLSNKREAFEIFKIQVYKNILETEQKYSAVELAAQPVVVTEQGDGSQLQQPLGADKNDKPPSKPNQRPPMEAGQGSSRGFNREHLNQLTEQINGLDSKLEGKLKSYISKFTADNSQLNEKVHELTAQNTQLEAYLKEIDRKLHSMLLSEKDKKLEKENFRKAAIEKAASDKNSTEKVFNSIKTFIYILLVLIVGLGAFIYRLRGDIKHSKLL